MVEVLVFAVLAVIVALGVVFLWKYKRGEVSKTPNYGVFFTMGAIWLAVGLIYMFYRPGSDGTNMLLPMGLVFFIVGLGGISMGWITKRSAANEVA